VRREDDSAAARRGRTGELAVHGDDRGDVRAREGVGRRIEDAHAVGIVRREDDEAAAH